MINVTLKESNRTVDLSTNTKAPIIIENQLDTSLDSGELNYLKTETDSKGLNEALAGYSITIGDKSFDFVGMDSRALLRREPNSSSIYSHQVALTEPSKLLQGVMIDGFGVTQPETVLFDNKTKTVKQDSEVLSAPIASSYMHEADGAIAVSENVENIIDVQGSFANTAFTAYYDKERRAIIWSAQWRDSTPRYTHPFTVTIIYTYICTNAATLKDVVDRLLTVTPFDGQRFKLTSDVSVLRALHGIVAPEFKWNTQTTLWECLLQVGAVIDAMPRLVADDKGNYTVVTFDFVNAYVCEVNSLDDGKTNALGESVDESLYNTALSSIVENLREDE